MVNMKTNNNIRKLLYYAQCFLYQNQHPLYKLKTAKDVLILPTESLNFLNRAMPVYIFYHTDYFIFQFSNGLLYSRNGINFPFFNKVTSLTWGKKWFLVYSFVILCYDFLIF